MALDSSMLNFAWGCRVGKAIWG